MNLHRQKVLDTIDNLASSMRDTALQIGRRPELGHEEIFASSLLVSHLSAHGFVVRQPVLDLHTAFIAEYKSAKDGPVVAYLCEYDALPALGHACGHHLIGTMGLAAGLALRAVADECGGTVRVYGTPAEETSGAKVPMADAGLFDDVDAALMAHPYYRFEQSGTSLAMDAVEYAFYGKAAHAAANPHEGVNALDAVLLLFNAVAAMRQQTRSDARIHGIIVEGGQAPNIIPDYTCARFYIRSADRAYTNELTQRMLANAEGAARQTGCRLESRHYEYSYDELRTNAELSDAFNDSLTQLGVDASAMHRGDDNGSVDLGNVSLRCPAIHPYIQTVEQPFRLHTESFRDAVMQDYALDAMLLGAKALALTGLRMLTEPAFAAAVKRSFADA